MLRDKIRKTLNITIIILFMSTTYFFIIGVGGNGVLLDLYDALIEIQEVEAKGLLENPPSYISNIAKREIRLVHNSKGLKKYILETEKSVWKIERTIYLFVTLFILSIIARIYFRKPKLSFIKTD